VISLQAVVQEGESDFIMGSGSLGSDISCIVHHAMNIVETVWGKQPNWYVINILGLVVKATKLTASLVCWWSQLR